MSHSVFRQKPRNLRESLGVQEFEPILEDLTRRVSGEEEHLKKAQQTLAPVTRLPEKANRAEYRKAD